MKRIPEEAVLLYKGVPGTLEYVVELLKQGQLVVLPCDTIYGLSGIYGAALPLLRRAKEMVGQHEFPVLATIEQAKELCDVPDILVKHWPCALTAILNLRSEDGSLAIRVPNDPFVQHILQVLKKPIYSTSVNPQGYAITNSTDIIFTYKQKVQAIVVDEQRKKDTPSTLIDCTVWPYTLLRQGAYDADSLLSLQG